MPRVFGNAIEVAGRISLYFSRHFTVDAESVLCVLIQHWNGER